MQILIFWQGVRSFYGFYSNMTRASKLSTFIGVQVLKEDQKENEQEVNMLKSNYFDQNTDLCHNRIQSNFATKWHKVKFFNVFVQYVQTTIYIQFHIYLCVG